LRRLFSTFAPGWPGAGLLSLRLVAALALVTNRIAGLRAGPSIGFVILDLTVIVTALLLLVGLWTPVVGTLVTLFGFWSAYAEAGDVWASILLGTIGGALALVGPGAWSADARLFGWRRINVRERGK